MVLEADNCYKIGEVAFSTSLRHQHGLETYGIKFDIDEKEISFMVDTKYSPELLENYKNSYFLIMNVVRLTPHESGEVMHLSVEDVKEILSVIKPKMVVLTHFGMTMLKAKPWELTKDLTQKLGIEVIAASDGMKIEIC